MPRNITPSDIDMVVTEDGVITSLAATITHSRRRRIVQFEYTKSSPYWGKVPTGQHKTHEDYVLAGEGRITAICAYHRTPTGEDIRSLENVLSFQVMTAKHDAETDSWDTEYSPVYPGEELGEMVKNLLGFNSN